MASSVGVADTWGHNLLSDCVARQWRVISRVRGHSSFDPLFTALLLPPAAGQLQIALILLDMHHLNTEHLPYKCCSNEVYEG